LGLLHIHSHLLTGTVSNPIVQARYHVSCGKASCKEGPAIKKKRMEIRDVIDYVE
jgi:hypothetical protein